MENSSGIIKKRVKLLIIAALIPLYSMGQNGDIRLGLHFDPVISWFGTDIRQTDSDGARPGYNLGLTFNKYFSENYAFSSGINIISAGGRISSSDTTIMDFTNFNSTVLPGNTVVYKVQYLSIPLGLKLQTNQIGYITYFTDIGIDPKIVIGGKADISSLNIKGEKALPELKAINLGWHITAGIEYSLGGQTAVVLGMNFENNFMDITKETGDQRKDRISHKLLGFRLGINF
ncbi:MAG TPA: porin family protein [Bacteroidales bacterium]|nr:porin family protein [Bacteroidales bacterium]